MQLDTDAFGIPAGHRADKQDEQSPDAAAQDALRDDYRSSLERDAEAAGGLRDQLDVLGGLVPDPLGDALSGSILAPLAQYVIGPAIMLWLCAFLGAAGLGGPEAASRFFGRSLGWAISGVAAALWLPVVLAAKATGRTVPVVGFGLIDLVGKSTPILRDPASDPVEKTKTVNPVPVPRAAAEPEQWHVLGKRREGNSVGVIGGPGSGKNAAIADYAVRDHLLRSGQNMLLVAPKLETAEIALSYSRPQDRIFFYSWHPGDRIASALDVLRDPERIGVAASIITEDPGDQAHWREQAASCVEVLGRILPVAGEHPSLIRILDIISTREELARWRRRAPLLEGIADEPKEWGFIRSGTRKYLRPLMFREGVRRAHSATARALVPTYAGRPAKDGKAPGRDVVILRPRPGADAAEQRLVRAALDSEYRRACEAGDAGGPGVRVIVDEAASYMDLGSLPEYLEIGRGPRVMMMYVLQSTRQLVARLTEHKARELLDSTDIICAGRSKDELTARLISTASGEVTVHYSGPRQHGETVGRVQGTQRPRILLSEMLALPKSDFVVWDTEGVRRVRIPKRRHYYLQEHPSPRRRPHPQSLAREEDYALDPIEVLDDDPGEDGEDRPGGRGRDRGPKRGTDRGPEPDPDDII